PGLDRRLGDAVARLQGHAHGRPDGLPARHPAGPAGRRGGRREEPAARPRRRPRRGRRSGRSPERHLMAAPTAPVLTGGAKAKLDESVFGLDRNDALVHEVVKSELAARRQGTSSVKTRGLVSGGRSKPWRQKGTGRARAGTTRASQWTGGGVVFGPQPRSYIGKVNRKERAKALRIALSAHVAGGSLAAVDAAGFDQPRTSAAAELLAGWRGQGPL